MKTKLIALATVAATFVPVTSVYAANPVMQEIRTQVQQRGAEIRNQIQDRREEARATASAQRQELRSEVAKMHADRLNNRFGFYNRRLTTVIEKIQSRIGKMKEDGKDMGAAQAKLDEAKAKLAESNKYAMEAVEKFKSIDPAKYAEQRDMALEARDLANKGREAFVATVKLLRECVELLKALK